MPSDETDKPVDLYAVEATEESIENFKTKIKELAEAGEPEATYSDYKISGGVIEVEYAEEGGLVPLHVAAPSEFVRDEGGYFHSVTTFFRLGGRDFLPDNIEIEVGIDVEAGPMDKFKTTERREEGLKSQVVRARQEAILNQTIRKGPLIRPSEGMLQDLLRDLNGVNPATDLLPL